MLTVAAGLWGGSGTFDIQGLSHGRGSLRTALLKYKEVLKAAPISTAVVEEEGKIPHILRLVKVITKVLLHYIRSAICWSSPRECVEMTFLCSMFSEVMGARLPLCIVHFCWC